MHNIRLAILSCIILYATPAHAQNTTCSNRPTGDSSNACANTRFVQQHSSIAGPTYITNYGAKCDSTTDDSVAIQAVINSGAPVLIPPNKFCKATLSVTTDNAQLTGSGQFTTGLIGASLNQPVITVAAGLDIVIGNMQISHTGTPTSGGDGIRFLGRSPASTLFDLHSVNNYIGLNLGPSNYSPMTNIFIERSISHGIFMSPTATETTFQWQMNGVISQLNGGDGLQVTSIDGPVTVTSLGNWDRFSTFANTGAGLRILGATGKGIYALRLSNSFLGGDGDSEIVLDTYGSDHVIANTYLEQGGLSSTGPTFSTPPSNVGSGINATANNVGSIILNNVTSTQMSNDGVTSAAPQLEIIGGNYYLNNAIGIDILAAGRLIVTGAEIYSNVNGLQIGAAAVNGNITGNNIVNNSGTNCVSSSTATLTFVNNTSCPTDAGQYIESVIASGSSVSLTSATPVNITNISLSAGDWDVWFETIYGGNNATTVTNTISSISQTTGTQDMTAGSFAATSQNGAAIFSNTGVGVTQTVGPVRKLLSTTTTIYAVAQALFATNTANAYGVLRARRIK